MNCYLIGKIKLKVAQDSEIYDRTEAEFAKNFQWQSNFQVTEVSLHIKFSYIDNKY